MYIMYSVHNFTRTNFSTEIISVQERDRVRNRTKINSVQKCPAAVKAIILMRRIHNDFPKLTSLRVPKVTIFTHSQRSIGKYMYRFLYNDFYFNDRFLLVNSLELALGFIWLLQYTVLGVFCSQVTPAEVAASHCF